MSIDNHFSDEGCGTQCQGMENCGLVSSSGKDEVIFMRSGQCLCAQRLVVFAQMDQSFLTNSIAQRTSNIPVGMKPLC